jgi:hypothetical protein
MRIEATKTEWEYLNDEKNAYSGMISGHLLSGFIEKEYYKYAKNSLFDCSLKDFVKNQILNTKTNVNFEESQWNQFIYEKLNNIYISIVFFNGYDLQYTPSLYFVLSSKRDASSLNSLAIERFGANDLKRYTIANNNSSNYKATNLSSEIIDDCITAFRKTLITFIREFFLRFLMPLDYKFFKSIIIDINDINIKKQSISIDENLKNKLFELSNRIDDYSRYNNITTYADITDFIIHERTLDRKIFDFPNKWNKISETITVNKNYIVSCNRFKKLYQDSIERQNYEVGCYDEFRFIEKSYL